MTKALNKLSRFGRNEDGAGTVFGLYIFCTMLMVFGLAIDTANTYRNRTALMATVDIGAHAGAVAIAYNKSDDEVKAAVMTAIEANLPTTFWGSLLDVDADVSMVEYDPVTYHWVGVETGDDNGVVVRVDRSRENGNPVSMFVMGLMGITDLPVYARSAAIYDINGECNLNDGIYAKEKVTITTQADVGSGYCIHSEDFVWLPQQNTFQNNTMVTMPNLADCSNKCTDEANPGIRAREAHMRFPDFRAHILSTHNAFITPGIPASGVKYDWYHKEMDTTSPYYDEFDPEITLGNTADLKAFLGLAAAPTLGAVIPITWDQFHAFNKPYPSGLVYNVQCTKGGKFGELQFSNLYGQLNGAVLLTNCRIQFNTGSKAVKSIIITTAETSVATIQAGEGTTMGDPTHSCGHTDRTIIMGLGDVSVPADFTMSNVTLIVDGNVDIAAMPSSSTSTISWGFAIYSTGTVSYSSKHTFRSCYNKSKFLTPEGKILRIVEPPSLNADGSFDLSQFTPASDANIGEIVLDPYSTTTTTTTTSTNPAY